MNQRKQQVFLAVFLLAVCHTGSPVLAGGVIPDRINQIIIEGKFSEPSPSFYAIFAAEPLKDARGRLLTSVTVAEFTAIQKRKDEVVIKLYGKQLTRTGRVDFFFGTQYDADRPWNNGDDFHWQDWEKTSPDVWDNIALLAIPARGVRAPIITDVTIRRGGKILYNSRAKESYSNRMPIKVAIGPVNMMPRGVRVPVLNLAQKMAQFRTVFYELGDNSLLRTAYDDLGQTDKNKYAKRGTAWCSEFASHVYRQNGVMTPDPNAADVHWKSMRPFFEAKGHVYPIREVMGWPDKKQPL